MCGLLSVPRPWLFKPKRLFFQPYRVVFLHKRNLSISQSFPEKKHEMNLLRCMRVRGMQPNPGALPTDTTPSTPPPPTLRGGADPLHSARCTHNAQSAYSSNTTSLGFPSDIQGKRDQNLERKGGKGLFCARGGGLPGAEHSGEPSAWYTLIWPPTSCDPCLSPPV